MVQQAQAGQPAPRSTADCDREGRHLVYSQGVENEHYLRGAQIAGAAGRVRTHVDQLIAASQVALPEQP